VDDTLRVRGRQRVGDLLGEVEQPLGRQRTLAQEVAESPALQQLHDDEGPPAVLRNVVDSADPGMAEGGRRPGLPPEALESLSVAGEGFREELERHIAAQTGVPRPIDLAHPPVPSGERIS